MEDILERACRLVESYLSKIFGSLRVYRDNHKFLIPWGFSAINVFVYRRGEELFVGINAPVALRVPGNKELLQFLLTENNSLVGCAFSVEFESDVLDILVGTKLRFTDLSRDSLEYLTLSVGNLANEYGEEIIAVFGGMTFKEYIDRESIKENTKGEKLIHDTLEIDGFNILLEMYMIRDGVYSVVGKLVKDGVENILINAKRQGEPSSVFETLERVKNALLKGDIKTLRNLLTNYEMNLPLLCEVLSRRSEHASRLKSAEDRINELSNRFIKGEISHKEYKKRLSDIERLLGSD